jgi:NADH-quinone oxidoreductase subunit L
MKVPMVILAFLAVFGGVAAVAVQGALSRAALSPLSLTSGVTLLVALLGFLAAYRLYARRGLEGDAWLAGRLGAVLRAEYGIEALYRVVIQRPAWALGAWLAARIERGFLGFGPGLGTAMGDLGQGLTAWQSGQVRRYALSLMIGAALVVLYAVWR